MFDAFKKRVFWHFTKIRVTAPPHIHLSPAVTAQEWPQLSTLLFAAYGILKQIISIISPFRQLSLKQAAVTGTMADAADAALASPVKMSKVRMQGQYGNLSNKWLRIIMREM